MSYTLKNVIKGTYPSFSFDYTKAMVARGSLALPMEIQKQSVSGQVSVSWSGDTVHIYLAFVSEDGMLVSDSEYVGSETIK